MRTLRLASLALPLVAAAGCGSDPFIGAYTFTDTRATMTTQPISNNSSQTLSGTLAVTQTSSGGYQLAFQWTDSNNNMSQCNLGATSSGDNLVVANGQTCTFPIQGGSITSTVTMGNGLETNNQTTLSVTLQYSYTGQSSGFAIQGTGSDVVVATKAKAK